MKIKWPTGFGGGKTFTLKPSELWSEQEIAETEWPKLMFETKIANDAGVIRIKWAECKRMSAKQVYTKEQLADSLKGIHVEFPRDFKHYLVVRLDTNTAVKWDAKFKRREDPYNNQH